MIRKYFLLLVLFAFIISNADLQAQKIFGVGDNSSGQLGDGTTINKSTPVRTVLLANNWVSASNGATTSMGVRSDGTLWTWGSNTNGQLGNGTFINSSVPVQVGVATNWAKVYCGNSFNLAIKTDGTLWAWGKNDQGQLGDGTLIDKNVPTQIVGASNWSMLATGSAHVLAIRTDGSLWAWGKNAFGQLGDNTTINKSAPIRIGLLNTWANVDCGNDFTIATQTNGTLWAWGFNGQNQLGDGTILNKLIPTQIGAATNWANLATGKDHTIATQTNGTLWAWGFNGSGQLGDNSTINKSIPTQIGLATNWAKVDCGVSHSIAIKTDNSLWGWGSAAFGQLGDGTNINKSVPTNLPAAISFNSVNSNSSSNSTLFVGFTPSSAILTQTAQPKHVVNCLGTAGNLLSTQGSVTFIGSPSDVYYQWFKESPTGFLPVDIARINRTSLTFTTLQYSDAAAYYCNIWAQDTYDPSNSTQTFTTATRIVDVLQNTVITEQPMAMFGNVGDIIRLTFKAHVYGTYGSNPTYKPTVQWFRDTVRAVAPIGKIDTVMLADNGVYDGTRSSILSITIDSPKRLGNYWASVSGQCNSVSTNKTVISAPPTITVNTQPKDVTTCKGTDAMYFVTATSSNSSTITYQWWANGTKLTDQLNPKISGSNSASITLGTSATYGMIQCQLGQVDLLASATSNIASLTIKDVPVITSQPSSTLSVQAGKPLVIAVGVVSNPSNTFSWVKGNNLVAGQTSATLSIASATTSDAGVYTLVVINDCGAVSSKSCTVTINLVQEVTDATGVEEDLNILGLHETSPNPTNDMTNISFNLTNTENVKLTISDVYGNSIATLFEGISNSGLKSFNFSAKAFNLNSGVYFVTLSTPSLAQTKKFTVVK